MWKALCRVTIAGHIISKHSLQPHKTWQSANNIANATTAHFTLHIPIYKCTNCSQLHVKICPGVMDFRPKYKGLVFKSPAIAEIWLETFDS